MASVRSRSLVFAIGVLLLSGCASTPREQPALLKGHVVLDVDPNPLVARKVGNDVYEFAFDIIMREAGGVDVRIQDFTVDAIAFKTVTVQSQTFPAQFIVDHGLPASIAAGKYLRFSFVKRWTVPTRLLLSGAALHVSARTVDANGRHDTSEVRIGVVAKD
ncbi:MAG TPA: hypothetical protein VF980_08625 [Thermoanaerobaculia bacterium]